MTRAIDIIKRSMRQMKVYGIGETPTAAESQDMLTALNAMLGAWSTERMLVYVNSRDSVSLSSGTSSYTIGPSGGSVTSRPVEVLEETYLTYNGIDYPIRLLTQQEYDDIPKKDVQGIPQYVYIDSSLPNVTAYVYPVPNGSMTLNLVSQKQLISFPDLTTDVTLPLGYEQGIAASLSEIAAPEFGVDLDASVVRLGQNTRRKIKRINAVVPILDSPAAVVKQRYYIGYGFI